eukprot:UN06876
MYLLSILSIIFFRQTAYFCFQSISPTHVQRSCILNDLLAFHFLLRINKNQIRKNLLHRCM